MAVHGRRFPHRVSVVRETVYSVFSYCIFSVQFHALTFIMVPLDMETLDVPTKRSYFNWMIGKAICNSDPNSTKLCHKNHGHPLWQTRKASVVKQTRPWHKQLCEGLDMGGDPILLTNVYY